MYVDFITVTPIKVCGVRLGKLWGNLGGNLDVTTTTEDGVTHHYSWSVPLHLPGPDHVYFKSYL